MYDSRGGGGGGSAGEYNRGGKQKPTANKTPFTAIFPAEILCHLLSYSITILWKEPIVSQTPLQGLNLKVTSGQQSHGDVGYDFGILECVDTQSKQFYSLCIRATSARNDLSGSWGGGGGGGGEREGTLPVEKSVTSTMELA